MDLRVIKTPFKLLITWQQVNTMIKQLNHKSQNKHVIYVSQVKMDRAKENIIRNS